MQFKVVNWNIEERQSFIYVPAIVSNLFYLSIIYLACYLQLWSYHSYILCLALFFKFNIAFSQVFHYTHSVQFTSDAQSCPTLCDPVNHSTPGLPVHHQLPEFTQTHVHWVSNAIQPSHPLSSPSPLALNLSQHQDLFQWVNSSYQVAKVLEFQLHHQSFQWILSTDFL